MKGRADTAREEQGAAARPGPWKRVLGSAPVKGLCLFALLGPLIEAVVVLALTSDSAPWKV